MARHLPSAHRLRRCQSGLILDSTAMRPLRNSDDPLEFGRPSGHAIGYEIGTIGVFADALLNAISSVV